MSRRRPDTPRKAYRNQPRVTSLEGRLLLSADVLTYHNDNTRDGVDASETTLTPGDVTAGTFGKVGFDAADGTVYAQPLYKAGVAIPGQGIHNVLIVATEHDSVYAFDADTGATLWHVSMLGPGETPAGNNGNAFEIAAEVGITATPVIDPATGTIYVEAMSQSVSGGTTTFIQRLHALDIATGADKVAPKSIDSGISYPGTGPNTNGTSVIFDPGKQKDRESLTLSNGVVYTGWTSYGDVRPFSGWIIGFDAKTLGVLSVLNTDSSGTPAADGASYESGADFWNSGGGFPVDAQGNLYAASGNGPFDAVNGNYGDSVLKVSTAGGLKVADYFTPYDQRYRANKDSDLGSGGMLILPDMTDAKGNVVQLAVADDKDGNLYLINRNSMGGFNSTSVVTPNGNNNPNVYQEIVGGVGGRSFGSPAYFNGQLYIGGQAGYLRAYKFVDGKLNPMANSVSANTFGYPATSPSISANGTANGIVWAVDKEPNSSTLYAYDANDLKHVLYTSDQAGGRDTLGAANKFVTPMIANGRVYVATTNGVAVYGLLGPATQVAPLAVGNPGSATSVIAGTIGIDPAYPESALTYTWSTASTPAGAPAPTFSANGTHNANATVINFGAAGGYVFQVTITDPAGHSSTSNLGVYVVQFQGGVAVSPAGSSLPFGSSQQYVATVLDQFGAPMVVQPPFNWSVAPGGAGGSISRSGLYFTPARVSGSDTVVASAGGGLGGTATVNLTTYSANVNFTDGTVPPPAGYVNDTGLAYGTKAPGLTYGWNADNTANMVERHSTRSADSVHDGFALTQGRSDPNASWSIAVPNGVYRVTLLAGDPAATRGLQQFRVNGALALSGNSGGSRPWIAGAATVTVRNGQLTVSNGPRARGNQLDAVNVQQLSALPSATTAARLSLQASNRAAAQAATAARIAAAQAAAAARRAAVLAALQNRHHR